MSILIKSTELCRRLDISKTTEWRWRQANVLPQPLKIRNQNYYLENVVDELINRYSAATPEGGGQDEELK